MIVIDYDTENKGVAKQQPCHCDDYATLAAAARRLVEAVRSNLTGIDETEIESPGGWWETSTGADFGADILERIEAALAEVEALLKEGE